MTDLTRLFRGGSKNEGRIVVLGRSIEESIGETVGEGGWCVECVWEGRSV